MTTTTIPATLDALTPEWLTRALRDGGQIGEGTVTSATVEPVGQGVGILCQLGRITLTYDQPSTDGPRTLIAKMASTDPQTRGMVSVFRFYEREVRFYRDLADEVDIRTARCYFSDFDAASGDFILLLEDFGSARIGDQLDGASIEDASLVIAELAKLHAAWWNSPRLNELTWMPSADDQITKTGVALYPQAWPIFMERLGHALPEEMRAIGEKLGGQIVGILDRFVDGPPTVCQGDVRLDNLFFAARPGDAPLALIDWQITLQGVGTYDVGYFMTQSLDTEVRRAHETELLQTYHRLLTEGGVSDYSYEQMLEHYRWVVLFCFAYPVIGGGFGDLSNERGYALGRTMMERSAAAIMDWKAGELLEG